MTVEAQTAEGMRLPNNVGLDLPSGKSFTDRAIDWVISRTRREAYSADALWDFCSSGKTIILGGMAVTAVVGIYIATGWPFEAGARADDIVTGQKSSEVYKLYEPSPTPSPVPTIALTPFPNPRVTVTSSGSFPAPAPTPKPPGM